ncbi:IL17D [Acanthosepion pharaonis]|uniref:IL17D n=1 Tax=Acanthosepion pharaonis TaxID=158019 RepID=A0A812ECX1_ACAPH|nr:IL17D [Sepia pharaonis]
MNVPILMSALFYVMVLFGSGALPHTKGKELDDLSDTYRESTPLLIENETVLLIQNTSFSIKSISNENIMNRSACTWTNKRITNSTLFPSVRDEAVCNCKSCNEFNEMHACEPVRTPMFFLKRISTFGRFAYVPVILEVATGCTCVHKNIV